MAWILQVLLLRRFSTRRGLGCGCGPDGDVFERPIRRGLDPDAAPAGPVGDPGATPFVWRNPTIIVIHTILEAAGWANFIGATTAG